jgi:ABC-type Fe3+-hydroxamate transport system substrate-binding protein
MISDFGKLFNKRTEAQKLTDKITFAYNDFQQFIKDKSFRKVAYFIWANPYMVAGKDTFINEMLTLNRFQNIYLEKGRYPEIKLEKIRKEGDPEIVFLSSEPFPFKDEHAFEIGRNTHHAKTIFVDGEMFSWYGSRLLKAFDYFKQMHQKL